MKRYLIAALCVLAVNPPLKPKLATGQPETHSSDHGQTTVTFVNNEAGASQAQSAKHEAPHWYASPERQLVFVGILTLLAIWYQAKETAKATKAMRDTVRLQEVQMRQWVDVSGWDAVFSERQGFPRNAALRITFEVTNPTNWPLTVHVWTNINRLTMLQSGTTFLSPKNPYRVEASIALNEEELASFMEHGLFIPVQGTVSYSDIEGDKVQPFGGHLICQDKTKTKFRSNIPMTPTSIDGTSKT